MGQVRETIKIQDFYDSAKTTESLSEELTDTEESLAWMVCVYFCNDDIYEDLFDWDYRLVDHYEERGEYGDIYYAIYERKSDNKLFMIWSDYENCCEELVEVTKETKTETVNVYN